MQNIFSFARKEFRFVVFTKYNESEIFVFLIKYDKANYEK